MGLPPQIYTRLRALEVAPEAVEERFILGSGPGGQKINKTSTTVWLRHAASGIEVRCQRERSQATNRELAWDELCRRLELSRRHAAAAVQDERETARRRTRQKSRTQKNRMVQAKHHRARTKSGRGRVGPD
jgi:protein subunit release factor B